MPSYEMSRDRLDVVQDPRHTGVRGQLMSPLEHDFRTQIAAGSEDGIASVSGSSKVEIESAKPDLNLGWLQCEVVDEVGAPLAAISVQILDHDEPGSIATTDASGQCSLKRPRQGEVKVSVRAFAEGRISVTRVVNTWTANCRLVLSSSVELYGTVQDATTATPIPNARVVAVGCGEYPGNEEVTTDHVGRFGPLLVPSGYEFLLAVRAPGFAETLERHELDAGLGGSASEVSILLHASKDVVFSIFDGETGLPIAGATIRPFRSNMGGVWTSDTAGVATAPGAGPIGGRGHAMAIEAAGYCSVSAVVSEELAGSEDGVPVPMYRESVVRVVSVDDEGLPRGIAGFSVKYERIQIPDRHGFVLVDPSETLWPGYIRWDTGPYIRSRSVVTDEKGLFVIDNIPPGLAGIRIVIDADESGARVVREFSIPGTTKTIIINP